MATYDNSSFISPEDSPIVSSDRRIALAVGINNSEVSTRLETLKYAEKDAYDVYSVLQSNACGFDSTILTGEKAETGKVRSAILHFVSNKVEQDFLLFYFIGHAQPVRTKDGQSDIYLVTYNFDPDEVIEDPPAHLSLSWLRKILYQSKGAGKILIVLDCCYAGNMIETKPDSANIRMDVNVNIREIVEQCLGVSPITYQMGHLRVILTATGYNQSAQERKMTSLFLYALQGNAPHAVDYQGSVNIHSLYAYLQEQMPQEQLPNLSGDFPKACTLAYYPHLSDDQQRKALKAKEDGLKNEFAKLAEQLSDVSKIITDPKFFEKQAATNSQNPVQYFDHTLSRNTSFTDLHLENLTDFFKKDRVQIQDDFTPNTSLQDQLRHFGFLQDTYPTFGILLCFGLSPTQWIPGAFTRCTLWSGNNRLGGWDDAQDYRGSLIKQFELSRDFLRKHLRLVRVIGRDERNEELELPLIALEEALANALVHREYPNQTTPVYLDIFNDHIEIKSPGSPPEPMTLELMEEEHTSHPRNPQIARLFYLYGYVETVGSGIQRMQHALEKAGLLSATFDLGKDKTFKVIFYRPKKREEPIADRAFASQTSTSSRFGAPFPEIWNVPRRHNVFFTGRALILQRLYEGFALDSKTGLNVPQVIIGPGGIGKTQIAAEYAYRYREDYHTVLWVRAATEDELIINFKSIAHLLQRPEDHLYSRKSLVQTMMDWFMKQTDWLLILDDADDLAMVEPFLPKVARGHILLTSRARTMLGIAQQIKLERLNPEDGALYILRRAGIVASNKQLQDASGANVDAARQLAQLMDGLPLALEQAGAYINDTASGVRRYLRLYEQYRSEIQTIHYGLVPDYSGPIVSAWKISKKIIQGEPAAFEILQLCAFLYPNAIPYEIFIGDATLQLPVTDPLALSRIIAVLRRYSLIEDRDAFFSIHPVFQEILLDEMNNDTRYHWAKRAVRAVSQFLFNGGEANPQEMFLHVQKCVALIKQWNMTFPEAKQLLLYVNDSF